MPKTNFTKVEEVLEQGLRKYSVEQLLEIADQTSAPKKRNPTIAYTAESDKPEIAPLSKEQSHLIHSLERDVKRLRKKDQEIYTKLGIGRKNLKKMIENPSALTPADWETIKQIRTKIDQYKAEMAKQLPQTSDEDLVESERKDHINRRYNVNKKWLPLT